MAARCLRAARVPRTRVRAALYADSRTSPPTTLLRCTTTCSPSSRAYRVRERAECEYGEFQCDMLFESQQTQAGRRCLQGEVRLCSKLMGSRPSFRRDGDLRKCARECAGQQRWRETQGWGWQRMDGMMCPEFCCRRPP